jgi:membrane protein
MFGTVKRAFSEFSEDNGTIWAAALTYFGVLSLFPALAALVAVVGLVMNPQTLIDKLTAIVGQFGPESAVQALEGPINSIASSGSTGLLVLILGLLGSLWSASAYVGAFTKASNVIYEVPEGRPVWKLKPLQMLITLVIVLLVAIVLIALVISGPVAAGVGEAIGLGSTAVTIYNYAKWPVMAVLVLAILGVLYYSTPNARLPKFSLVTPGAIFALVVWVLASLLFAFYVANFGSYNKTYGALGGVIAFLVWLWITNIAVVFGQEVNSEHERGRELNSDDSAERRIQLPPRDEPKDKQLPDTAYGAHQAPAERRRD